MGRYYWTDPKAIPESFSLATFLRGVGKTKYSFLQPSLQASVLTWDTLTCMKGIYKEAYASL